MPSLESFKKPIMHSRDRVGSFFVGSLVGMTDYFYKRGAGTPHSFWYATKQPNGEVTRGALYEDMVNHPDKVAIVMHPPVPKQVMQRIEEQIRLRVPPNPLALTEKGINRPKTHPQLERVKLAVEKKALKLSAPMKPPVAVYLRPHQLRPDIINQMVTDFTSSGSVYRVDYHLEPITDGVWGYAMQIYCN